MSELAKPLSISLPAVVQHLRVLEDAGGVYVEANIRGVHAYQILLTRQSGKGDPACYGGGALTEAGHSNP